MDVLADKLIVVCGPTASGKTEFALEIAKRFKGEIVSADSMQVYKGLEIGTAALTEQEACGIKQHMSGFLSPDKQYSVADYVEEAGAAIKQIQRGDSIPVLCGGTGLYIESLVEGTIYSEQKPSPEIRSKYEDLWNYHGGEEMLEMLRKTDSLLAEKLHLQDKKRILRGLEQYELTGLTAKERNEKSKPETPPYNAFCIGLMFNEREFLYNRINSRVDNMMKKGLLNEAKTVYDNRNSYKTAVQAIGYKELFPYFKNEQSLEQCVDQLKKATRNYAKRQLTWFRHMNYIKWLDPSDDNAVKQMMCDIEEWLV